jgi:hypothetical protein
MYYFFKFPSFFFQRRGVRRFADGVVELINQPPPPDFLPQSGYSPPDHAVGQAPLQEEKFVLQSNTVIQIK